MGVDEQGGHFTAVAGERHVAVVGMGDWFFVGWVGVESFHFSNSKGNKEELPSAFLQAWVAAMRGVGISRPLENSTTPKRARARPPQLILRTRDNGRKPSFDANTFPTTLKGSYTPPLNFQ